MTSLKLLAAFALAAAMTVMVVVAVDFSGMMMGGSPATTLRAEEPFAARTLPPSASSTLAMVEPPRVVLAKLTLPEAVPPPVRKQAPAAPKPAPDVVKPRPLPTPLQRPGGEMMELWIQQSLKPELPSDLPPSLVYQAVQAQDDEFLSGLLQAGFSPNQESPEGDSTLCAAVRQGRESALRLLLHHGASTDQAGKEGQKPVVLASLSRNRRIMDALLDGGADPNTKFATPVDEDLLKTIAVDDLRHYLRSDRGVTILMACAARGDVENAVTLMKHSANTELSTKRFNRYALDFAAEQRYLFLMRVLLGRPADAEPDLLVTVNLGRQRAWIAKNGKILDSTVVSSGRDGYDTPPGRYVVTDKHREWTSTLYKASMPWFMRLNCGSIGLHAGYVTGHPASHGCIRLPPEKAREWFKMVGVGDEVQIVE